VRLRRATLRERDRLPALDKRRQGQACGHGPSGGEGATPSRAGACRPMLARLVGGIDAGGRLLDDLGGLEQHVVGDGQAERLGGVEVDDELGLPGLLH
jgi:hypothetical protein